MAHFIDDIEEIESETENILSSRLAWDGASDEQLEFMRKVYDQNYKWSSGNGTFIADIPAKELDLIEDGRMARIAAAAACRDMLSAARLAVRTAGVNVQTGLTSAYRSATRQLSLWQSYFPAYYNETAEYRESLSGGAHGEKAISYLAAYIRPKVAIPGYSNHQNGIAVDLLNIENGEKVVNKTRSPFPAKWRESWLWSWLETNGNSFGFYQNTNINEPWHWEYRGRPAAMQEDIEEECGCNHEEYENDYAGEDVVVFPSGEQLDVISGASGENEEYYDPNNSGNPLLDTSGANKAKKISANFKVAEFAKSGGTAFDKARIDPELVKCLQAIRVNVGKSVTIRSGYRSYGYNAKLRTGSKNVAKLSQHMSGRAADIAIEGMTGFEIAKVALDVFGCNIGIGLAPGFAHIDVRGVFAAWRYSGDPEEMSVLVEKIRDYQKKCLAKPKTTATEPAESIRSRRRRSLPSAALGLYYRGYLSYQILKAINAGERDLDRLTDMVFYYRHPEKTGLSALLQSSEPDYHYFRTEWNEIRSKIIEPIFTAEEDGDEKEFSSGRNNEDPFWNKQANNLETGEEQAHDNVKGREKWFNESRYGKERSPSETQLVAYIDASKTIRQSKFEALEKYDIESLFDTEGAPNSAKNNWVPLGPSVVEHGQASLNPEVSGRVMSIAVGPAGKRVYIGTANGGVWYSPDEGASWQPLDQWSNTLLASATPGVDADSLSIGSIAVSFDKNKREKDIIFAGTGEPLAEWSAGQPGRPISALHYFGVGIKYSKDGGLHWTLEGKNLKGFSIYKIVIDPSDTSKVYAATSGGLFQRPQANFETWIQINIPGAVNQITDFLITRSAGVTRYYASEMNVGVYSGNSVNSLVLISGASLSINNLSTIKIMLAASESNPAIVYAFYQFNSLVGATTVINSYLYRLDANTANVFQRVTGVPNVLNGGQGYYSIILAVDPLDEDTVYIGGDWVYEGVQPIHTDPEAYTLSLFKGKINKAALTFPFNAANTARPELDPTYIGTGIHADGHAIGFALDATGTKHDPNKVWIACDGGVFFSNLKGVKNSFTAKNKGLNITQFTYFSQDPVISSVIFAGSQDNGTIRCLGETKWKRGGGYGDGGGVAIDPNNRSNLISQMHHGNYYKTTDRANTPWTSINLPTTILPISKSESDAARFYSPVDSFFDAATGKTLMALGTTRLWFSNNGGTSWRSLPNNLNPYLTAPPSGADYLGAKISFLKIVSPTRIYVTTETDVFQFDLGANWTKTTIPRIPLTPGQYFITCLDVEPTNFNNFYVSLGGPGSFNRCYYCYIDTAGAYKWVALGPTNVNIPCHAVIVDPVNPLEVYLGSDVGTWKRIKNPADPKKLIWTPFSYGLPESPITDLKIHATSRLLRAATHGRGMFEIPLDFPGKATGTRKTKKIDLYLRGNKLDNRREDLSGVYQFSLVAPDPDNGWAVAVLDSPDIWLESRRSFNFIMVRVNNRGFQAASFADVFVTLLVADASTTIPDLPAGLLSQLRAKDITLDWTKSKWKLVGRRKPTQNIASLMPQNVEFPADFSSLPGSTNAWAVAIVTTLSNDDPFAGTEPVVLKLISINKQVACKKVRVL